MLYPQDSETREIRDLSGFWKFRCDVNNEGRDAHWQDKRLEGTVDMPVPAAFNDLLQDARIRDHVGDVWYEREAFVPAGWEGKRVTLRIDAAAHRSVVWVNGTEVGRNKGGFLPFELNVSKVVSYGKANRITIVVDNTLDGETLPPGWTNTVEEVGRTYQDYQFDFFNYAGLIRPVRLVCTPQTHISDVTAVTDVDGSDGVVEYEVEVEGNADVAVRLLDEDGQEVAKADGAAGKLTVKKAKLWQPGAAYLYELEVTAGDGEDVYRLPVGIRTVEVKDDKFLINGQPFYFRGFGKHEEMDIKGRALDHTMIRKDFSLLRWIGANSFRTSHYPYSEEILQLADREGIVLIDESPAVGMFYFHKKDPEEVARQLEPLLEHHLEVMERLVARDKNHPSVVMWSVANEAATQNEAFGPYFEKVFAKTRECDPQDRPTTIVLNTWFDNDLAAPLADVICLNRYWGWYGLTGQLERIEGAAEWQLNQWYEHQKKPIIMTEYGADTIAGMHQDPAVAFTEEYQVGMVKEINRAMDKLDFVIGEHIWNFADFMTKQGITRVIGNRKGAFTRNRQPKALAHYLRKRWTGEDLFD